MCEPKTSRFSDTRIALDDAGHVVNYNEVPEGHSPVTWTNHLGWLLVTLFGPTSELGEVGLTPR